jgi:hypothetical protein
MMKRMSNSTSTSASEQRHRRASAWSIPPLLLIVLAFFLPTVKVCTAVESPMALVGDGLVWVATPYATAAVLIVVTALALRRASPPGRVGVYVASVAIGGCGLVGVGLLVIVLLDADADLASTIWCGGTTLALGLGGAFAARARQVGHWSRWLLLIATYTCWAAPIGLLLVLIMLEPNADRMAVPGAHAYLLALAALALITAHAIVSSPRE